MKFDTPATSNPIDQLKVIGKPTNRIDGPLKVTGRATYAYEWHDPRSNLAYGYVVGSAIAKGRIASIGLTKAKPQTARSRPLRTRAGRATCPAVDPKRRSRRRGCSTRAPIASPHSGLRCSTCPRATRCVHPAKRRV